MRALKNSLRTKRTMFDQLSKPARRALQSIGITSYDEVIQYSEQDLLSLHGFGPKGLRLLKEELKSQQLQLNKNHQLIS
ncbi:DNA-binding protein [Macrococcoides canis]|uniref:DNA-binding protein n=1 Tax=Macrococcoides canis TaxID=1855823 RepID=A0A4R6C3J5_9STAP|nr:DNA-binding protein [Macrococcus canis]TDM20478.1 DNA-binding protein [Macrococcus canis]TDM22775.1 DNA-binding protein [Macrococcus canis]TDM30624.1 DNA-binding protein [Macrococcus canis]TDM37414.1 DNA-binding protein [Macrococcus canis]